MDGFAFRVGQQGEGTVATVQDVSTAMGAEPDVTRTIEGHATDMCIGKCIGATIPRAVTGGFVAVVAVDAVTMSGIPHHSIGILQDLDDGRVGHLFTVGQLLKNIALRLCQQTEAQSYDYAHSVSHHFRKLRHTFNPSHTVEKANMTTIT